MDFKELLGLLPEGASLLGVLVCVWLFLRERRASQQDYEAHLDRTTRRFDEALRMVVERHSNALDDLSTKIDEHNAMEAQVHTAMQRLIDGLDQLVRRLDRLEMRRGERDDT